MMFQVLVEESGKISCILRETKLLSSNIMLKLVKYSHNNDNWVPVDEETLNKKIYSTATISVQ